MDPIAITIISHISAAAIGLGAKMVWDYFQFRVKGTGAYTYNDAHILHDIHLQLHAIATTLKEVDEFQGSPEMKRLIEESHELFKDRNNLENLVAKQTQATIETNILLRDLKQELVLTTNNFASFMKSLAAALNNIRREK